MYGLPEPLITEDAEGGELVASISITREPVAEEPYIAISFQISLRVFCIAYALSKLEEKKKGQNSKDDSNEKSAKDKKNNTGPNEQKNKKNKEDAESGKRRKEPGDKRNGCRAGEPAKKDGYAPPSDKD